MIDEYQFLTNQFTRMQKYIGMYIGEQNEEGYGHLCSIIYGMHIMSKSQFLNDYHKWCEQKYKITNCWGWAGILDIVFNKKTKKKGTIEHKINFLFENLLEFLAEKQNSSSQREG